MQIGELVKDNIRKIFEYCESDPTELVRLMSAEYSHRTFGLAYPFCADANKLAAKEHRRYWADRYVVGDKRLRVCNHWFEKQRDAFCEYLSGKRIVLPVFPPRPPPESPPQPPRGNRNSRYGSTQIGDAQNAFIRFILSRLGEESFDERYWQETKAYFNNHCAYCDSSTADQMDHGVPINRSKLGEHRLGNAIPACKGCNIGKHQRDYKEHLRDDLHRIDRIETYMASKGYVPLGGNDQVKDILDQAHKEVAALADRYIEIMNMVIARPPTRPELPISTVRD
jgi:5-methylcytosine-specific restriction endonuclease McrA